MRKISGAMLLVFGVLAVLVAAVLFGLGGYNRLVGLEEAVDSQWGQVENVYQRRADLIPNLVESVKGAAAFERDTLTKVIEARARAVDASAGAARAPQDPQKFQQYQAAQDSLGTALSRLLVVVERYPELKATEAYRDLMTQLEGTENRIAVERMRFNDTARAFNTERRRFPTALVAKIFSGSFPERSYFKASPNSESAPQVRF